MEKDKVLDVIEDLLDIDDRIKNLDACIQRKNKKVRELAKRQLGLIHYLTRGGFIQDCHGKWCKEGDKVRYKRPDPFGKPNTFIERTAILEYTEGQHFKLVDEIALFSDYIELIEPCEPDICKDFEGEEL